LTHTPDTPPPPPPLLTHKTTPFQLFDRPAVALAWSPGGDFLATAHSGELGISLWASKAHFGVRGGAGIDGSVVARRPTRACIPAPLSEVDGGSHEAEGKQQQTTPPSFVPLEVVTVSVRSPPPSVCVCVCVSISVTPPTTLSSAHTRTYAPPTFNFAWCSPRRKNTVPC